MRRAESSVRQAVQPRGSHSKCTLGCGDGDGDTDREVQPERQTQRRLEITERLANRRDLGAAERARTHWRTIFEAYITAEPPAGNTETYLALERGGRHRIERWLQILTDEGALPPGDNEQRARFLSSVVNGLSIERALPADGSRALDEKESLRLAVASVLR